MSKLILNPVDGKKYILVERLSEFFETGIPELDADLEKWDEIFSGHSEEPKTKCVYLIGFSDGVTKVGISQDVPKRIAAVSRSSGRTVVNEFFSGRMPIKTAFEIECVMKKVLEPHLLNGEFFNVTFKKAKGLLEYYLIDYGVSQA